MTDKNLPTLRLSAQDMTCEEQFLAWRAGIKPFFDARPVDHTIIQQYTADSTWYLLDNVMMAQTLFSASVYRRDPGWLGRHDDMEYFVFPLILHGSYLGVNGERQFRSDQGSVTALDMGKEIYSQSSDCNMLSIVIPRHRLRNADKLHGMVLPAGSVRARLLRGHIMTLWETLPSITLDENPVFSEALIGLVNALFMPTDASGEGEARVLDESIFNSVKKHIDANLHCAQLGTDSLCKSYHCSRATLYRLFQPHGGVMQYIKERRLVAAFKALIKPSAANLRIMDVAMKFGFSNQSTFSRLFRQRFGITPSDVATLEEPCFSRSEQVMQQTQTAKTISQWLWSLG